MDDAVPLVDGVYTTRQKSANDRFKIYIKNMKLMSKLLHLDNYLEYLGRRVHLNKYMLSIDLVNRELCFFLELEDTRRRKKSLGKEMAIFVVINYAFAVIMYKIKDVK